MERNPAGMPGDMGQPQQDPALEGERIAATEAQLLQNLLTEGVDKDQDEIDDYMATSFLDRDELAVIRDYQELLSRLRRVAKLLGLSKDEWQKCNARKEIINRMMTIAQTSKSKGGAGFKAVRTEKIVQEQDLYEEQAIDQEEKNLIDRILAKTEGQQVVGDVNTGTYHRDPGKW